MGKLKISIRNKAAEKGIFALIDLQNKLNLSTLSQEYKDHLIMEFLRNNCSEIQVDATPNQVEIIGR